MLNVQNITHNGKLLAVLVKNSDTSERVEFVSPKDFPLQVGFHNRKQGDNVPAHQHALFENISIDVQEVLFMKKGHAIIHIYDGKEKITDVEFTDGDIILLNCGHSVDFDKDCSFWEVKQGPYREKTNEKISL